LLNENIEIFKKVLGCMKPNKFIFTFRYAGLYWTKPEKFDKMDCKGIETVRRDNCQLVANLINTCLQKILMDK